MLANENKNNDQKLSNRISRIEGQLKGVRKMLEKKDDCINIITQITAIREAVTMLGIELMKDDLGCQPKNKQLNEKYLKTLFKLK